MESNCDLSQVYWIGGSGCAGKSSVARLLQQEFGFTVYHCDDHWGEHEERSNPAEHPGTFFIKDNMEEYFRLAPDEFIEASRAWFKEDFAKVLEDLEDLETIPTDRLIVEGVTLEPDTVLEVADPQKVIFMVASEEFQRKNFLERDFQRTVFARSPDPEAAFEAFANNLAFQTRTVRDQALDLGFKVITTDGTRTLEDNLALVKQHFDL